MGFNPLQEKGIPLEKQLCSWQELNVKPYDKAKVDPYTRTRGILMNGIEIEAAIFSHQFARHTDDMELKQKLAMTRRIEQQQQKMINWMIPGDESTLSVTIGYEQVAVDLTAYLAQTEPDPYAKQVLDFALIEDFDHLYRYANLMKLTEDKAASDITRQYTEITVGRPTILEHRHPFDEIRNHFDRRQADIRTKLHALTIVAAEQQTMNFYMNVGDRFRDEIGRNLYQEIAQIEEQHVSQYESLLDPGMSWFERLLLHEYNECWLYYSLMQHEPNGYARSHWEMHLAQELEHLKLACELMRKYEDRDPEALLPKELPEPFKFQPNINYVRKILETQIDLTANGPEFAPVSSLPRDFRYFKAQAMLNKDGAPSQQVIQRVIEKFGKDYRQELAGPHPVAAYRQQ
jgi:rubrerythrin